jgi:predicted RNA methylase
MARLAAQEKLGYYPTPSAVIPLIASHLKRNGKPYRVLDPCAGTGAALAQLEEELGGNVETLGVELSPKRAEKLKHNAEKALHTAWNGVLMTDASVALLFLNPPYDHARWATQKREEAEFLRRTVEKLQYGGVLAFLIPQHVLADRGTARLLAGHFDNLSVYRFPDEEYEAFGQVVVFGIRTAWNPPDGEAIDAVREYADADLPQLTKGDGQYELPASPAKINFRRQSLDARYKIGKASALGWPDGLKDAMKPKPEITMKPLIPPRKGHIAMLLASGMFRTTPIVRDGDVTLLKGRAVKYQEKTETIEDDTRTTRIVDKFRTTVGLIGPDGIRVVDNNEAELRRLMQEYGAEITEKILETEPLYNFDPTDEEWEMLGTLSKNRDPLPGQDEPGLLPSQKHLAMAGLRSLQDDNTLLIQGEMGVGKTTIAAALIDMLDAYPALVLVPAHLVKKWRRELKEVIPGVETYHIERIGKTSSMEHEVNDVREFLELWHSGQLGDKAVAVMKTTMAKAHGGWGSGVWHRYTLWQDNGSQAEQTERRPFNNTLKVYKAMRDDLPTRATVVQEDWWKGDLPRNEREQEVYDARQQVLKQAIRYPVCPVCGQAQYETVDGVTQRVMSFKTFEKNALHCGAHVRDGEHVRRCQSALYDYGKYRYRRYAAADYIKDHADGEFQMLIADEVHYHKGRSDRGRAFARLLCASKYHVGLTGTIFGGTPESIYWILHRMSINGIQEDYDYNSSLRFMERYGVLEQVIVDKGYTSRYGSFNASRRVRNDTKKLPGVSPAILEYLLKDVLFVNLDQLGVDLPPYQDRAVQVSGTPEQADQWNSLSDTLLERAIEDKRYLSLWLQWALGRPNSAFRSEEAVKEWRDDDGEIERVEKIMDLPKIEGVLPKEQWLVDFVRDESEKDRAVIVYCRQTGTRDIRDRIRDLLRDEGFDVAVLDSSVSTSDREAWIERNASDVDVLITNPRLVETGLDLIQFCSVVFYEPVYSLSTMWQAERRVWRLGQAKPVKVVYLVYRDSWEENAIALMGKKKRAAQMVYGDDIGGAIVPEADTAGSFKAEMMAGAVEGAELPDLAEMFNTDAFDLDDTPVETLGSISETEADEPDDVEYEGYTPATFDTIEVGAEVCEDHPEYGRVNGVIEQIKDKHVKIRYTDTYDIGENYVVYQEMLDGIYLGHRSEPLTMAQLAARMKAVKRSKSKRRKEEDDEAKQLSLFSEPEPEEEEEPVKVISTYTPQDALDDGLYVDVSDMATEAGFRWPVVMTRGVHYTVEDIPQSQAHQGYDGRLWDLLNVLRYTLKKTNGDFLEPVKFNMVMHHKPNGHVRKWLTLTVVGQYTEDGEPMLVVMHPEEM